MSSGTRHSLGQVAELRAVGGGGMGASSRGSTSRFRAEPADGRSRPADRDAGHFLELAGACALLLLLLALAFEWPQALVCWAVGALR